MNTHQTGMRCLRKITGEVGDQFIYQKVYKLQMHPWGQEVHGLLFKDGWEERGRTVGL